MSENPTQTQTPEAQAKPVEGQVQVPEAFTQADVDRIVKDRITRERAKFADYDELKVKAGQTATVEDRMAAMEKRATDAEAKALRNDVATKHGITAEDRDLFLLGNDEETLTAQAKRLAERDSERKKNANQVPREGANPQPAGDESREFARRLFANAAGE